MCVVYLSVQTVATSSYIIIIPLRVKVQFRLALSQPLAVAGLCRVVFHLAGSELRMKAI
jgi:hypothetical protein